MNPNQLQPLGKIILGAELAPLTASVTKKPLDSKDIVKNAFLEANNQKSKKMAASSLEESIQNLKSKMFPCKHCGSKDIDFKIEVRQNDVYYAKKVGHAECKECFQTQMWKIESKNYIASHMIDDWNKFNNIPAIIAHCEETIEINKKKIKQLKLWMNQK